MVTQHPFNMVNGFPKTLTALKLAAIVCALLLPLHFAHAEFNEPVLPLPDAVPFDAAKAHLGRQLFHDTRLSGDQTRSCASCHDLSRHGVDGRPVSLGVQNRPGTMNAPSVFNSGFNFVQFWDGRAASLEEQVDGPIHNPVEMDSNWTEVLSRLNQDPQMVQQFQTAFSDQIRIEHIRSALAEFQRSLVTADSRFDRYLKGDTEAITPFELNGYQLFKAYGCTACHQGQLLGGNLYATMGQFGNYFEDRGHISRRDLGRFNLTNKSHHRHQFKVPSLRNSAVTGPYFHDGSVTSLYEVVRIMGRYQLGREIPPEDVAQIVAFLISLNAPLREPQP